MAYDLKNFIKRNKKSCLFRLVFSKSNQGNLMVLNLVKANIPTRLRNYKKLDKKHQKQDKHMFFIDKARFLLQNRFGFYQTCFNYIRFNIVVGRRVMHALY